MPNTRETKSIQIKNSYRIWKPTTMKLCIQVECCNKYGSPFADDVLHRSYVDMYVEWWLHSIGYYLTRNIALFEIINLRCKDVDLGEHK